MGKTKDIEVFLMQDEWGDLIRILEWADHAPDDESIGSIESIDGEGQNGVAVHLTADAAMKLGEKLIEWAKSRGA